MTTGGRLATRFPDSYSQPTADCRSITRGPTDSRYSRAEPHRLHSRPHLQGSSATGRRNIRRNPVGNSDRRFGYLPVGDEVLFVIAGETGRFRGAVGDGRVERRLLHDGSDQVGERTRRTLACRVSVPEVS